MLMTLIHEAEQIQIFILNPDHSTRTVVVPRAEITLGAKGDNNIVLDDQEAEEYHARLEPEEGHYRVTDLNSATGTFLGETRLKPGEPTVWLPDVALRIGESWLSLQPGLDPLLVTEPTLASAHTPISYNPEQVSWSTGEMVGLYLGTSQITIAPGNSGVVSLVLFNRQLKSEHFNLTVTGVSPNWIAALPSVVTLGADSNRQLDLEFQLPHASTTRAGRYRVAVQLAPQGLPAEAVEVTLTLTVLAFSQFRAALNPQSFFVNDHAQLKIENLGNLPETFSVSVEEADEALTCNLPEAPFRLAEGESQTLEIQVQPPQTLWGNQERTYPLSISVEAVSGQVQTLQAEVLSLRTLPAWLVPLIVISGLGLVIILGFFLVLNLTQLRPTAPNLPLTLAPVAAQPSDTDGDGLTNAQELQVGTNPNLVDTDGDGLNDMDEQRAGTNPLITDSDGDGLSDGQEVLVLHTSPINADTDGDGQPDNVDSDPGHLPTPIVATVVPATLAPATLAPAEPTSTVVIQAAAPPVVVNLNGSIVLQSQRDGTSQIYLLQPTDGGLTRLTNNNANDENVVRAPQGNLLAFDSNRDGNEEIYTMQADGTQQTRLTNNDAKDFAPAWSADGAHLAFLSDRSGSTEIYVMTLDGAAPIQITSNLTEECCLAWSPTKNILAYMAQEAGSWGLFTMGGDGLNQKRLAAGFAVAPIWSPDGTRLAFVSQQDGNSEIYVINADGSGQTRLTTSPAQDTNPLWSPDGSHLAFISDRDGSPQIYLMNGDGTGQTRLLVSAGRQCCLIWSSDGSHLAFANDQTGNDEVYIVDINGQGVRQLTNSPGPDAPLVWYP
jgi:Tol biopolymer transport system component